MIINQTYCEEELDTNCAWNSHTTAELIEMTKFTSPMIYKQMLNNGVLDESIDQMNFYTLFYDYNKAIKYGISDSVKIDYSLLTNDEIALILSQLSKEIPAFEILIKEYETANNQEIKKSRLSIYKECKADIKKMKCHVLRINQELKRRAESFATQPNNE